MSATCNARYRDADVGNRRDLQAKVCQLGQFGGDRESFERDSLRGDVQRPEVFEKADIQKPWSENGPSRNSFSRPASFATYATPSSVTYSPGDNS